MQDFLIILSVKWFPIGFDCRWRKPPQQIKYWSSNRYWFRIPNNTQRFCLIVEAIFQRWMNEFSTMLSKRCVKLTVDLTPVCAIQINYFILTLIAESLQSLNHEIIDINILVDFWARNGTLDVSYEVISCRNCVEVLNRRTNLSICQNRRNP